MTNDIRSPAELRAMFGANLRQLTQDYPSVAALCRQLGVNRTQFNRYLFGESVPRADVLDRICRFFDVDARILLKPIADIPALDQNPTVSTLTRFLTSGAQENGKNTLLPGFYAVTEGESSARRLSLLYARHLPQCTLLRGFTARRDMPDAPPPAREKQGFAVCADDHIYMLISRRNGEDSRVYLVTRDADQWRGTVTKPSLVQGPMPVVLRSLGTDTAAVLDTARKSNKGV
ncbi:helix-turn-helix transcriptional regulator [Ruegeria sp. EL01]|jgi:transcriptional regulator with XRE-family HTH domain|uniref:helix-turn-helix domain-containing protein n=1 Tax=Ruegeria sp. EL01 TaxID=2107578 RepID=UPI0020B156B7|nr:helix-turn-helix transcriptional regulator [Ruegeria sp. EL01]